MNKNIGGFKLELSTIQKRNKLNDVQVYGGS